MTSAETTQTRDPVVVRGVAWLLVVLWVAFVAGALLTGGRAGSYRDLERDLERGDTTEVTVLGGLDPGSRGYATVDLTWRTGVRLHRTTVIEAQPRDQAPGRRPDGVSAVLTAPVVDQLRALRPDATFEQRDLSRTSSSLWGLVAPTWTIWVGLVATVGTLTVLVSVAQTWRATRWAWFWLVFALPPLGMLAFLLLGGPTGLARPRREGRPLTGGWAFLLALLLGSAPVVAG